MTRRRNVLIPLILAAIGLVIAGAAAAQEQDTVRPGTTATEPLSRPGVRIQAAPGPASTPLQPLSSVQVTDIVGKFAGTASDAAVASDLRATARESGWDIYTLLIHTLAESMKQMNDDKEYFLQKLADMNQMAEAMGDYLKELNDISQDLADSISDGTDVGEDSKGERSDLAREGTVWAKYDQCLAAPAELRTRPYMDCVPPVPRTRTRNLAAKVDRTLQSLDSLDASLARVDVSAVKPEGREFILNARDASARLRRILARYRRLAKQFPYRPRQASDFQSSPKLQEQPLPTPSKLPVREMRKAPVPQPAPARPLPSPVPSLPDSKKSRESK